MPDTGQQYAVFIATTQGPVRVQHIDYEDDGVLSHIGVEGSTRPEPITRDYRHFVDRSSGLVARRIGHDAFRVSLSAGIEQGHSWQAGMMLAHILKDRNQLSEGDTLDGVDQVLWLTGEVRAGEKLAAVQEVTRKFDRSADLFRQAKDADISVSCFAPEDNADDVPEDLPTHVKAETAPDIAAIENVVFASAASGTVPKPDPTIPTKETSGKGKSAFMAFAGAALAAAVLIGWKPEILGLNDKPTPPPVVVPEEKPDTETPILIETPTTPIPPVEPAKPEPATEEQLPSPDEPEVATRPETPVDIPAPAEPDIPVAEPLEEQIVTGDPVIEAPTATEETTAQEDDVAETPQEEPPEEPQTPNDNIRPIRAAPLFTGNAWYARKGQNCNAVKLHRVPVLMQDANRFRKGMLDGLCGISFVFDQPAPGSALTVIAVTGKKLRIIAQLNGKKITIPAPQKVTRPRVYNLVILASPKQRLDEGRADLRDFLKRAKFADQRPDWIQLAQDMAHKGHHLSVIRQRLLPDSKF